MKNTHRNLFFISILISLMILGLRCGQEVNETIESNSNEMQKPKWTPEQEEVKTTVDKFLLVAGNYDLSTLESMITRKANIGTARFNDGVWTTEILTFEEYYEKTKSSKVRPYYESVSEYTIHVSEGNLAFVRADAILYAYGIPLSHNIDYFTLIKKNGRWRFVNASFTTKPLSKNERKYDLTIFGKSYAQAWCSQKPNFVASFFLENGSLTVNNGTPAVGRIEISKVAESFMIAFPDMIVTMDSLKETSKGIEFHWTLTGKNTGPNGTGNQVRISGFELWHLDDQGLIKESQGSFNAEEYKRQLKYGVNN